MVSLLRPQGLGRDGDDDTVLGLHQRLIVAVLVPHRVVVADDVRALAVHGTLRVADVAVDAHGLPGLQLRRALGHWISRPMMPSRVTRTSLLSVSVGLVANSASSSQVNDCWFHRIGRRADGESPKS